MTYEPIIFPSSAEIKFIEHKSFTPTLPELIKYIKEKRLELLEWLPLMKLQDWDTELICDEAEKEVVTLQAIEEYLIANRNVQQAWNNEKNKVPPLMVATRGYSDRFPLSPYSK